MPTRRSLLGLAAFSSFASMPEGSSPAGEPVTLWPQAEPHPIWPGPAPGGEHFLAPAATGTEGGTPDPAFLRGVRVPAVHAFRPGHADGRAVLVIPGGAYSFVSIANEGLDVARRFTASGVTVLVLVYRLPGEGWAPRADVPLQDAQRALRWARFHERELGIDGARIGVLAHGMDDSAVPVQNSMMMMEALRRASRPVEAHFFEHAENAFALGSPSSPTGQWPGQFLAWAGEQA